MTIAMGKFCNNWSATQSNMGKYTYFVLKSILGYSSFKDSKKRYPSFKPKIVTNEYFMEERNIDDKLTFLFFSSVEINIRDFQVVILFLVKKWTQNCGLILNTVHAPS